MKRILVFVGFLGVATYAGSGHAQESARADQLFKEGTAALEAGRFAEACPKLAESRKSDPHALGTLLNLARCNEEWGKTATAYAQYTELEKLASERKQADRVGLARRHLRDLEGKLARITVRSDAAVKLDGVEIERGKAISVDPGPHTLEASAPDKQSWSRAVEVKPGPSVETIEVPALVALPSTSPTPPPPVATTAVTPRQPQTDTVSHDDGSSRRTVGYVVGGVGIAALAVGAITGVQALSKASSAKDCAAPGSCRGDQLSSAQSDYDSGKTSATISTITVAAGAVAVAAGLVLVLTSPKSTTALAVSPQVGSTSGGLSLRGKF